MGNLMNIPEIRFPEFKDDWEHKELNELLSESKKKNADLKYSKEEVLSVSGELGIVNQIKHLGRSYAGVSVHNYGEVEVGDIVYTKSPLKANPYGIIKINKGKAGIVSTLYAVYKVNEKTAYGDFLDYYFSLDANTNRYLRPLVKKGAKNDMKINNEYVLHDRIFAPTIPEQKRIANFFSVFEIKIIQLKEKKALLEEYKKGMMQKIFSQEIRFKDDDGKIFSEWEGKKLGEIAKIYDGTHQTPKYLKEGIPFYSVEQVTANNFQNTKYISNTVFEKENKRVKLEQGDILMTRIGDIGTSRLITWDVNASFYVSLALIKQSKGFISNYLNQYISTSFFQSELWKRTIHVAFPQKINLGEIGDCLVKLPCQKEQIKIANFLSKIDNKINAVNEQFEKSQEYKKGLLQKMYCV
jgi:type I restriction enzyme, S subunit